MLQPTEVQHQRGQGREEGQQVVTPQTTEKKRDDEQLVHLFILIVLVAIGLKQQNILFGQNIIIDKII